MKIEFNGVAVRRLGNYRYEVILDHAVIGLVSVARCTARSQYYQAVVSASGLPLPGEFSSVRKAANAIAEAARHEEAA